MSLDLYSTQAEPTPRTFIRGATLEFVMELPYDVAADFFVGDGISTTLESKLRRLDRASASGLIADLHPVWEPGNTKIRFLAQVYDVDFQEGEIVDTSEWPLGPAEFDLLVTRTVTATGITKKYRSLPVKIIIVDGVS